MINTVLRVMSTRSMMQAVYFCTGFESDCWHYGLAAPIYTHFTSPIRRYADIMVHRALANSIGIASLPDSMQDKAKFSDITDNINKRHTQAQYVSRASNDLWTKFYF